MNKACVFFKFSDITMHLPRNYKRYPDVQKVKNYAYDERYGNYTKADFYFLPDRTKYPVVVNVHGGGFVKGGKQYRKSICCEYAREGFFVYNVNYRLAPQYPMPSAVFDVINALNKLPELAKDYPLDLSNVTLTGDSAGAFYALAAVIASFNDNFRREPGFPLPLVKPTAFMGFFGTYRPGELLHKKMPMNMAIDIASALFGKKIKDVSEVENDPIYPYIDLVRFADERMPATFLVYSEHDDLCGGQGEALYEKLVSANVDVKNVVCTEENDFHCFHLLPKHKSTPHVMDETRRFLRSRA